MELPDTAGLTPRETTVLALIIDGITSEQAAKNLGISKRTVEFHRANIMQKLSARNVADLARIVFATRNAAEPLAQSNVVALAANSAIVPSGRAAFSGALSKTLSRAAAAGKKVAVLVFDIDRLKETNDAFGHAGGDAFISHVTRTSQAASRSEPELFARLEGDKFGLILPDVSAAVDAMRLAESIGALLSLPLPFRNALIRHTVSFGVSLGPDHGEAPEEVVDSAETALRAAKAMGGGGAVVFAHGMGAKHKEYIDSLEEARRALREGQIVPYYQPKISLETGEVCGFEALLRVVHPVYGVRLPASVSGALDHPELSVLLGRQMQTRIFNDLQAWAAAGVPFGTVAINASPVELLFSPYASQILEALESRSLLPEYIQVEVTETAMTGSGSTKIYGELQALREQGVTVYLDDFGTGYGSLTNLRDFPINGIKVDRSFVKNLISDKHSRSIVGAIILLAKSLDLVLVAEGIETNEQALFLEAEGCKVGQGFLYAKALPAEEVPNFIRQRLHRRALAS